MKDNICTDKEGTKFLRNPGKFKQTTGQYIPAYRLQQFFLI